MAVVWWCLIFVSVVLIIISPWQAWIPEEETTEGDDRIILVVMEMQGRLLIGAGMTQPEQLEKQLVEMEAWVTSDQTAVAVAAIRFFLDPEGDGKWRALALVNERLKKSNEEKPNHQLLKSVHKALDQPDQLNDEDRKQIRFAMGWFGKVLLSAGVDEGEPGAEEAASLRMQSVVMMAVTGFMALAVMAIGLLGVALLSIGLLMMNNGKLQLAGVTSDIPAQPYLGAFALYLMFMVLADFLSIVIHPLIAVAGMFCSIGIAFLWPRIQGLSWRETLRGFGWRRGKGVLREMGAGVVGYVAMTPVFALGLGATLILVLLSGWLASQGAESTEAGTSPVPIAHPVLLWIADGDWKMKVAVVFLASGLAPLFEETMFRGALYHTLRSRWGFVVSGLISGVIFAAVHPQGLLAIPALTSMGFGFAMIREWRGTLISSMTAHGLHNGILITTLILALS